MVVEGVEVVGRWVRCVGVVKVCGTGVQGTGRYSSVLACMVVITDLSPCDLHSVMWYYIQCDKSNNSIACQECGSWQHLYSPVSAC